MNDVALDRALRQRFADERLPVAIRERLIAMPRPQPRRC